MALHASYITKTNTMLQLNHCVCLFGSKPLCAQCGSLTVKQNHAALTLAGQDCDWYLFKSVQLQTV